MSTREYSFRMKRMVQKICSKNDKLCENSEIKTKIEALNDNAELPSVSKDVIKLLNKILVSRFHDWKPFLVANIL